MNGAPAAPPPPRPTPPRAPGLPVTRLHLGRILLLVLVVGAALLAGTLWLLRTKARPTTQAVDSSPWPAWMRQAQTYAPSEPLLPKQAEVAPDPNAALMAKLAALQADLERQRLALEALKKRPTGTTVLQQPGPQAAKATPPAKTSASMLFVQHDLQEPEAPQSTVPAYTLAPGATKLPCIVETVVNSDVEGSFTAKVSTNV